MNPETALVIMAKQPQAGRTKTRLCPPLSHAEAAAFAEALLLDTIDLACAVPSCDLAVAITPPESRAYFERITPAGTLLIPVSGADIGDCLSQALVLLLDMGYRKALALNADGPSLPLAYLQQAVQALDGHDLVLGPGHDGGYYLVGLKTIHPALFTGIAWSTGKVLAQTLDRAAMHELRTALTPEWYDVDTPGDLQRFQSELLTLPVERLVHSRDILSHSRFS